MATYEEELAAYDKEHGRGGASQIPGQPELTYEQELEEYKRARTDPKLAAAVKARAEYNAEKARPPATPLKDFEGQTLQLGPFDTHIPLPAGTVRSLAQIGSGVADIPLGYKQLINDLHAKAGLKPQFEGADQAEADAKRLTDDPLNRGFWGGANNILGKSTLGMLMPGAVPAAIMRAAPITAPILGGLTGALQGALEPVATGESRGANMAVGAGAGAAIPGLKYGLSKSAGHYDETMNPLAREAIDRGIRSFGLADTAKPGLMTAIRHVADALPVSKQYIDRLDAKRGTEFTRAVGRVIGLNTDTINGDQLLQHRKDLEGTLSSTLRGREVVLTPKTLRELEAIRQKSNRYEPAVSGPVNQRLDNLLDHTRVVVRTDPKTGRQYRQTVVDADIAHNYQEGWANSFDATGSSNHQNIPLMDDMRKIVAGALDDQLPQAYKTTNTQLDATKAIMPAAVKSTVGQAQRETGSISPQDLSASIANWYGKNATESPFGKLPQIGQQILRDTSTKDRTILSNSALPAFGILGGAGGSMGYIANPNITGFAKGAGAVLGGLYSTTGTLGAALSTPGVRRWAVSEAPGIGEAAARGAAVQGPLAWQEYELANQEFGPKPEEEDEPSQRIEVTGVGATR